MEVFRRNAQPHIADMRKRGDWGYVPNKQICVWGPRRIACCSYTEFGITWFTQTRHIGWTIHFNKATVKVQA